MRPSADGSRSKLDVALDAVRRFVDVIDLDAGDRVPIVLDLGQNLAAPLIVLALRDRTVVPQLFQRAKAVAERRGRTGVTLPERPTELLARAPHAEQHDQQTDPALWNEAHPENPVDLTPDVDLAA